MIAITAIVLAGLAAIAILATAARRPGVLSLP